MRFDDTLGALSIGEYGRHPPFLALKRPVIRADDHGDVCVALPVHAVGLL